MRPLAVNANSSLEYNSSIVSKGNVKGYEWTSGRTKLLLAI